ncbi:MAG: fluoride efflux transporter CrcB [Deinococcota bacterium]|nr:fluoride efflux transporter CrcB [Deinococcota bacterium]
MNPLWIALAGALGAASRYLIDFYLVSRVRGSFPVGTFTVNVTGSLALGFLAGLVLYRGMPVEVKVLLGTGFLGAYTTFSTWMYETARLVEEGAWRAALVNAAGSLLAGVAAAAAGLWLAALW